MVKMIKIPTDVFFLDSKAPIAMGFSSSCSTFTFLYFFFAMTIPSYYLKLYQKIG